MKAKFLAATLAAFCISVATVGASAQNFPNKPVRLLTGSPLGGGADLLARSLGAELQTLWGQPVVVEPKTGAFMSIAVTTTVNAPADGYTFLYLTSSVLGMGLHPELPVNLERDLIPITLLADGPILLVVNAKSSIQNVKDFIAAAKSNPGKMNFGSAGAGTSTHMTGELLNEMTGINVVHIPYDGGPKAMTALMAGEIDSAWPNISAAKGLVDAGTVRALGIATKRRSPIMPNIPTIDESGVPGYEIFSWHGLFAPRAIPKDVLAKLNADIKKVVDNPEFRRKLAAQGFDPIGSTSAEFETQVHNDLIKFVTLANKIGLKIE